jgi:PII-like signaling protein
MIFTPVAIVGAEIPSVRVEIAAIPIDVALISTDDLTGAPEVRTILLNGGPVPRRLILMKLLLVLSNRLPVTVAILPVGAEILFVLPDVSRVPTHVLTILAQVALVTPELAPILIYLCIGNGSCGLCADARNPNGHREGPGRCHGLPLIHIVLQWVSDALHPSDANEQATVYPWFMSKT